jgi:hypothetical protein
MLITLVHLLVIILLLAGSMVMGIAASVSAGLDEGMSIVSRWIVSPAVSGACWLASI